MSGIESIDEQLAAAFERRERARDLLVRSLLAIDAQNEIIADLIDQKVDAQR